MYLYIYVSMDALQKRLRRRGMNGKGWKVLGMKKRGEMRRMLREGGRDEEK